MQATLERLRARREERGDEGGFTLIELLIVIVILGILAAIVVFAVQNLTSSSAQSSCRSDFKNVETAVEAYKAQMNNYPAGSATQNVGPGGGGAGTSTAVSSPTSDNQLGATVAYFAGNAPGAIGNNTITTTAATANQAAFTADTTAAPNAAGSAGSELLVAGNTLPNTGSTAVGPWLKDVPTNSGHYSIFVANDGTGTVSVLDASGHWISAGVNACASIN